VTAVAVVIGNHQGEHLLPDCLDSLRAQTVEPAEIVVVDGGSTDASRRVSDAYAARFIELENKGLGSLYNAGVAATTAPYVLLSNNDVAYEASCIEFLVAALVADDSRFAADSTQLDWDGDRVIKARTTLRRGPLFHQYIPGLRLEHKAPAGTVVPTVAAHGAAMLVRRVMFTELGGFDETFFLDAEDLDLCWRAWLRGWSSVYVPEARLRHRVGGAMTAAVEVPRLVSAHHNMLRFALKCLPARMVARVVAGELLRLPRHPRVILPALARVLKELPDIRRLRREAAPSDDLFDWMLRGQLGPEFRTGAT
jgi:GT2 family glycosyltransferase